MMAPTSNSAMTLQQNRLRPAVRQRVIPAIPLPYIQKRKQQEATLAKAREEAATSVPIEIVLPPPSPTPPASQISPPIINGAEEQESEKLEESIAPSTPETPATPATPAAENEVSAELEETGEPEAVAVRTEILAEDPQATPRSAAPSESQSSASRSTYHMPPAFVPASHNHFNGVKLDSARAVQPNMFDGQPPIHHAHPSNGGSVIHGYPSSNNSSPAPPLSAGNPPPFPFPQPQQHPAGRHGPHPSVGNQSQQMINGYPPMGVQGPGFYPPRPDGFLNQGPDNFPRRQMAAFVPSENYSPSHTPSADLRANGYGPSTPRSIHGSQSSVANDHENGPAFHGQYPTAVISNGSNGQIDEVRLYQPPRLNLPTQNTSAIRPVDHLDGLIPYLQSKFGDATFADYALELRYSDDRAQPVRIPGHNLLFARSPTLKTLMEERARDGNTEGLALKPLLLESNDRFLRSDGFWMAMQRLYGNPLLDLGALAHMSIAPGQVPGSMVERFNLALGYAAAGHLLQMPPIVNRGIAIATHLIDWTTVETALDFALDGGLDPQWMLHNQVDPSRCPSTYGPISHLLIHASLSYVINNFPTHFELDTSAGEPPHNSRLPLIQDTRTSGHNSRLSAIKFGDHTAEENVQPNAAPSAFLILSRVLLNIPFHLLKYILESPLNISDDPENILVKQEWVRIILEERERRRLKTLNSIVSNADRKANARDWEAVGWQESFDLHGTKQIPILVRTWVNYLKPAEN